MADDDKDTEQETETKGATIEEDDPAEKPASPPSISDVYSRIQQNAPQIRDKIAEATDLTPKQVEDHLPGAMSMVRGAAISSQGGQDVTQLHPEALRAADPAATHAELAKEDPNAMSNQKKIFLALGSILPTVAGFAVGGWRGGQAGAQATGQTAQTLSAEMLRQQQVAFERNKFAIETGLKAKHEESYAKGEGAKVEQARIAGAKLPIEEAHLANQNEQLRMHLRKETIGEAKDIQEKFNEAPQVKETVHALGSVDQAKQIILSPSKFAPVALLSVMPRIFGEVGKLPAQEEERFKAPGGVFDRMKTLAESAATGQMTDSMRAEALGLINQVAQIHHDRLQGTVDYFSNQGAQRLKTTPEAVQKILGADRLVNGSKTVQDAEAVFRTRMAKKSAPASGGGNMIERVLGTGQSSAQAQGPADPVIDQYAKSHGLDYGMASNILKKRGYNAPGQ